MTTIQNDRSATVRWTGRPAAEPGRRLLSCASLDFIRSWTSGTTRKRIAATARRTVATIECDDLIIVSARREREVLCAVLKGSGTSHSTVAGCSSAMDNPTLSGFDSCTSRSQARSRPKLAALCATDTVADLAMTPSWSPKRSSASLRSSRVSSLTVGMPGPICDTNQKLRSAAKTEQTSARSTLSV